MPKYPARELNDFAVFVPVKKLKRNRIYYSIHFQDENMTIPIVHSLYFVGLNVRQGSRSARFQDEFSYSIGVRKKAKYGIGPHFESFPIGDDGSVSAVCEFDEMLTSLLRCDLNRRKLKKKVH